MWRLVCCVETSASPAVHARLHVSKPQLVRWHHHFQLLIENCDSPGAEYAAVTAHSISNDVTSSTVLASLGRNVIPRLSLSKHNEGRLEIKLDRFVHAYFVCRGAPLSGSCSKVPNCVDWIGHWL